MFTLKCDKATGAQLFSTCVQCQATVSVTAANHKPCLSEEFPNSMQITYDSVKQNKYKHLAQMNPQTSPMAPVNHASPVTYP